MQELVGRLIILQSGDVVLLNKWNGDWGHSIYEKQVHLHKDMFESEDLIYVKYSHPDGFGIIKSSFFFVVRKGAKTKDNI